MKTKGQDNRQHIIDAANMLFYRQGFNQTSFSEIADQAHIPRGNFYYYFKSKDDILAAVIEDRIQRMRAMLAEWDTQYANPKDRLHRFLAMLLNNEADLVRYGCPIGSLAVELSKTQQAMQSKAKDMFDVFLNWLIPQFEALDHKTDARFLALRLLAKGQGVSVISNAYADASFLRAEVAELNNWIDQL